ncbi:unnamed protein product [Microthlaspi erraticum]|uniref:Retrotransposon Copia-like N-terminal domain-containing protein n=1 Tax=Microthlaspi erraticum TaxID=1685480 RepID=A0A6D2JSY1_9BRAS|nr:unnamed protein product [Microthlaspi erraticum]
MAGEEDNPPSGTSAVDSSGNQVTASPSGSSGTQVNSGVVLPLVEAHTISPYTLAASDNPGALITSVQLNGENYNEWSSELLNALQAKRKLGFIHGNLTKPAIGSPDLENWLTVNSMLVGWIRASIEPKVRSTVTYITDARLLWNELRERFSVGNKVRTHQIKSQLAACRQNGQLVLEYYG